MSRYDDVHPDHIDPETGRPYADYSSPALDDWAHDREMDVDDGFETCASCPWPTQCAARQGCEAD